MPPLQRTGGHGPYTNEMQCKPQDNGVEPGQRTMEGPKQRHTPPETGRYTRVRTGELHDRRQTRQWKKQTVQNPGIGNSIPDMEDEK